MANDRWQTGGAGRSSGAPTSAHASSSTRARLPGDTCSPPPPTSSRNSRLTAFLRIPVVADQDLLAGGPEERRPVDGVVEAQAAVVEDVDVPGADLVQRLELEGGDPALLQDQQGNTASTAGPEETSRGITEGRRGRRRYD